MCRRLPSRGLRPLFYLLPVLLVVAPELLELPVPDVVDVEPSSLVVPLVLELFDEPLLVLVELDPSLVLEPDPVELVVEPVPELLVLELLLLVVLEVLFELPLPVLEDESELVAVESVVLLVVLEFVFVVWADSDSVVFSDWAFSSGFSASLCSWVVWVCSVLTGSCVRPGVAPMPLPWVSA